mmetsp:Transcript_87720/g.248615  ORF Transcript_87720/g.248615 Transcript_87720/m.248615 type:complete len:117 (-) Transcript_87720:118-468(-)
MAAVDTASPEQDNNDESDEQPQPSMWEILDELVGLDRHSLIKALTVVLSVLILISSILIYNEVSQGRLHLALLYGGFLLLVIGLIASIVWVISEATRLEAEGAEASDKAEESKKSD